VKFSRTIALVWLLIGTLSWMVDSLVQAQALLSLYELERGVRPVGMGGAFAGLADDESALYYNPAGLSFLGRTGVGSLVEERFGSATYGSFMIAGRYLGLGAVFITLPNISQRDANGQEAGKFNYTSYGLTLAAGSSFRELPFFADVDFLKNLGVGLSLKFYGVRTLEAGSGATFALDTSFLYWMPLESTGWLNELRFGLVLENLGPGITYKSGYREAWAAGSRIGVGAKLLDRAMDVALDIEFDGTIHVGGEYRLNGIAFSDLQISQLSLRLGLMVGPGVFAFSAGFGVRVSNGLNIDYALSITGELPASHRLGASYRFDMASLLCPIARSASTCYIVDESTQTRSYRADKDPPQQ